jgi:hypothetical protein
MVQPWQTGPMGWNRCRFACLTALLLGSWGCDRDQPAHPPAPSASVSAPAAPVASAPPPPSARSVEREEGAQPDAAAVRAGEPAEVGPAAPASASSRGVVLVNRSDEIELARLEAKSKLGRVKSEASAFRSFARGPAIAGDFAYWVSSGRLVRRRIDSGPLETLAEDARDGTRVAADVVGGPKLGRAAAAYLARSDDPEGPVTARLWVEGRGSFNLTPFGAAASSVTLVTTNGGAIALSLEGRTGMTPVHARALSVSGSVPRLEEDVVAWVAGPAQSLTEVIGTQSASGEVWAFVPLERDITRFGLAQIRVGQAPKMEAPVIWRAYPNGVDPAPAAASRACGGAVLYAVPAEARPRAPQELRLARLGGEGLGPAQVIARGSAFSNVSLAEAEGGLLVAYVADHRTWGLVTACPGSAS